jgi:hypothetical protein
MARSLTTIDHDLIRSWAEERGGKPSEVTSTAGGGDASLIRIHSLGFGGEGALNEISWDDWFRKFDEANLAFVCEEATADGQRSNFNQLVARETAAAGTRGQRTSRGSSRSAGAPRAGRRQAARPEAARTARGARTTRKARSSGARASTGRAKGAVRGGRTGAGKGRASTGSAPRKRTRARGR